MASVGSLFMSRWDVAANKEVPYELHNRLALAVGKHAYRAYRELIDSPRWQRLMNEGARPQRLLWASTGTKDPNASDTLYIEGLASPLTVNTMPENTLHAFADHGTLGEPLPVDGGNGDQELAEFEAAGVDVAALAVRLQEEGKESFNDSWRELLGSARVQARSSGLTRGTAGSLSGLSLAAAKSHDVVRRHAHRIPRLGSGDPVVLVHSSATWGADWLSYSRFCARSIHCGDDEQARPGRQR